VKLSDLKTALKRILCGTFALAPIFRESAFFAARRTLKHQLFDSEVTKHRIRTIASALQARTAAMITNILRKRAGSECCEFRLCSVGALALFGKFCLKGAILGLKLRLLFLDFGVLILKDRQALLKNRRRAMFVDQFLKKLKHGTPFRVEAIEAMQS